MKVVILAGGYGTRISEETVVKPKPMVEIGGRPILWHIMKTYSYYGFDEFIICAGYKQNVIKEWFSNYFINTTDVTFDFREGNSIVICEQHSEPWKVTVVDTGQDTMTGGRVRRIKEYVGDDTFMLTYGDGVADIDIGELLSFHREHNRIATLTATALKQRYGVLNIAEDGVIESFMEKADDGTKINIGYMVFEPKIFDYLEGDATVLEKEPLERLAECGELMAYVHKGFWQCMDTKREKDYLEELWASGTAAWKKWDK